MSSIEWTDETWNVTTGCTRVSAGCDNCYAVKMTKRLAQIGHTEEKYGGLVNEGKDHFNGKVKLHPEELEEPLHWRKPRRVFVNSMSDLFHPEVPFEFIDKVFAVISLCPDHTFQILTKRPDRMADYFNNHVYPENIAWNANVTIMNNSHYGEQVEWPLPNVWIGISVENQEAANERIPHLLECPATVRFLSCEPLLGPVSLNVKIPGHKREKCASWLEYGCTESKIDWVIAGGESGQNARPMHPGWVRSLRDQCQEAGVPFFFKQWGKWEIASIDNGYDGGYIPDSKAIWVSNDGSTHPESAKGMVDTAYAMYPAGKGKTGRELDGKEWNQFPEVE